jgi:hypothetical protein
VCAVKSTNVVVEIAQGSRSSTDRE